MQIAKKNAANSAIIGIYALLLSVVTIVCLYIGKTIFIPLALATLLSFFLSQFVTYLEKWVGRIASVLLVVCMVFITISVTSYIMTLQIIDLADKLPNYKSNIEKKIRSIHLPESGVFQRLSSTISEIKIELTGNTQPDPSETKAPSNTPLQIYDAYPTIAVIAQSLLGGFFNLLSTSGLVLLLVTFMLINREDLRGRIIRLIGQERISSTTRAIDDASGRISHYWFMQLIVNSMFGLLVAIGLYFLGIPNAVLWGGLGMVLRFVPYVGAWIAAFVPFLLSLAVSDNWAISFLIVCLFLSLELIICNIIEPWLYGSSTGISPMALIVSAGFWTWLWGPIGLVLSIPLTVCLVVLGHHVTKLEFLRVLLSEEQPLTPSEEGYHRILTGDQNGVMELVEKYLKTNSLSDLYDHVLVPVISSGELDLRHGLIDEEQNIALHQSIQEIIGDVYNGPNVPAKDLKQQNEVLQPSLPANPIFVLCIPAKGERDELVGAMLAQLLEQQLLETEFLSATLNMTELMGIVEKRIPDVICISTVAPSTVIHARYLCKKLHLKFPNIRIVIGMWEAGEINPDNLNKFISAGADRIVLSLSEAVTLLSNR